MAVKNLYLMRHGATDMNGCYVGSTDIPLSESGIRQVCLTADILRNKGITEVFCSPMKRCRQTLDLIGLECSYEYDDLLREVDFGRWETKRFEEIVKSDKELVDSWSKDPGNFSFPGGEDLSSFRNRVISFKKKLDTSSNSEILVVAHGGVIRYLICYLLGLSVEKYLLFGVLPGCFTSLELYSEGGILTGFNITG